MTIEAIVEPTAVLSRVALQLDRICDDDVLCLSDPGEWIRRMRAALEALRQADPAEARAALLRPFENAIDDCRRMNGLCPECGEPTVARGPSWERMVTTCTHCGWRMD